MADLPIGAGVDATKTDDALAFASCGDGTMTVVGEKDGKFEVEQVVKTPAGARTMGVDPTTHTVYLPTAEFVPPAPGAALETSAAEAGHLHDCGCRAKGRVTRRLRNSDSEKPLVEEKCQGKRVR